MRKVKAVHMIDAGGSREDMHECTVEIGDWEPRGQGAFGPVELAVSTSHGVSRSKVRLLKWSE